MESKSGPLRPARQRAGLPSLPTTAKGENSSDNAAVIEKGVSPSSSPVGLNRSVITAGNIHCNTCVNHIQNALGVMGKEVQQVNVRLNEVTVVHRPEVDIDALVQTILDEGFEVYGAQTTDPRGKVLFDKSFDSRAGGWFDAAAERWTPGPAQRVIPSWLRKKAVKGTTTPLSDEEKRARHLKNCSACSAQHTSEAKNTQHTSGPSKSKEKDTLGHSRKTDSGSEDAKAIPNVDGAACMVRKQSQASDDTVVAKSQRWKVTLSIGGMTCAACSNTIIENLNRLEPIHKVQIDLMSNSGFVIYDGSKNYAEAIASEIEDIGYEATVTEQSSMSTDPTASTAIAQPTLYRARLSIEGMTCAACSSAITRALDELPFVKQSDIVALTNSGEVVFEDRSNIDEILEKIDDVGYDATVEEIVAESDETSHQTPKAVVSRTIQIKVEGMFCDSCPPRLMEALDKRFGSDVTVEKPPTMKVPILTVTYEPRQPDRTIRSIISTIENSQNNFTVSIYHPPSQEERSKQMQVHERNRILRRFLIAFTIVIPTFIIGIVFMDLVPSSNPIQPYFMEPVWAGSVKRGDWAMFILATPAYFFAADVFHRRAIKEIRALWRPGSRVPLLRRFYRFGSMNLLISAGTTVAYVASVVMLIVDATGHNGASTSSSYFDSVVFLTFFILGGRFLEAFSKSKTSDAVSMLGELRPAQAMLVESDENAEAASESSGFTQPTKTRTVPADRLEVGDRVIVAHGASPPADGVILSGEGKFDESSLTGESRPVTKGVDETVFVGTVNSGNPITMRVTGIGGSSMLDQIVSVVREGLAKRAPVERLADVITGYFVPVITALAITTFIVWVALGYSGAVTVIDASQESGGWAFFSLGFAISVFVAACPCGIGLAAPTALFVGIGLAAKHGILVRGGGEAFQEAPNVDAVVFDKTGTLTAGGDLRVTSHETLADTDPALAAAVAARLEEQSAHPIAQAIVAFCATKPQVSLAAHDLREEAGRGLHGRFDCEGVSYEAAIGSAALMEQLRPDMISSDAFAATTLSTWQNQAQSVACLALRRGTNADASPPDSQWQLVALYGTSDPVRPSAGPTVRALQSQGIEVYMLSGDNPATARAVGSSLGISADHIFAGVLPTEKAARIRQLQHSVKPRSRGFLQSASSAGGKTPALDTDSPEKRHADEGPTARIAFVGDGINDAPALLAADVSISLATGSAIALTASSFVLLSPSLLRIPLLLNLSRRVMRRVALNYGWALVYNVVLVPVAAGVLFRTKPGGWVLGPVWAALAMAGSSVSVVLSSLALRWEGFGQKKEEEAEAVREKNEGKT